MAAPILPGPDGPSFLPDLTLPHENLKGDGNNNVTTTLTVIPMPPQTPVSVAAPIIIFAGTIAALVALGCLASRVSRRRMEKRERRKRIGAAAAGGTPLAVFRRRHQGEGNGQAAVVAGPSKDKVGGVRLEVWEVGDKSRRSVDDMV
ncbi:hypothetical protein ACRALDRAFT_2026331 [Sodiomyces alcalophilus JCM 7366]|uniref:uncharacterized protein n=1 Tax=Sodiomyces alcalophilus JCM 7366 TaxID=591952 RepID=UPI0039B4EE82